MTLKSRRAPRATRTLLILAILAALSTGALIGAGPALATGGCDDSWTNAAGGLWDTGTNWSTGAPPISTANACITLAGSYTVTAGNETITVGSLTVGGSGSTPTLQIGNPGSGLAHVNVSGAVANSGTISGGFGGTFAAGSMINSGTFEVPSTSFGGSLTFGNVTNTGTFSVAGGATLTLNPGTTFDNSAGTITNGTGTLAISTSGSPATLQLDSGGVVNNTGAITVADTAQINGGSICGNALTIGAGDGLAGGSLQFASSPGTGPACGTGVATDKVFIANVQATLSGTIPAAYTLTVGDGGTNIARVTLSGDVINNGTFLPGFEAILSSPTSSDFVTNNATMTVPSNPFTTQLNIPLVNNGTFEIKAVVQTTLPTGESWSNASTGTLIVDSGVTVTFSSPSGQTAGFTQAGLLNISGTINVADAVQINGGTICGHALNLGAGDGLTGASLSFAAKPAKGPNCPAGQLKNHLAIYNVTATIGSDLPVGFTVAIGDGGSGFAHVSTPGNFKNLGVLSPGFGTTLTVNGLFTNMGSLVVPASAFPTMVNPTTTTNTGTITVPKSTKLVLGGTLSNYSSATSTLTGGKYSLAGTLQYTGSEFTANGIVNDASSITLSGGTFTDNNNANALRNLASIAAPKGLLGLSGTATLTTSGPLSNAGTVSTASGTKLTTGGNYTQTSTGTWSDGVNSATKFGALKVTGTSTLAGTLALITPKTFSAATGTTISPLTSTGRTGTFTTITGTAAGTSGNSLVISYTPTAFTLTVQHTTVTATPNSGAPGSPFTVAGGGYSPGETVTITLGTTTLTPATADGSGNISRAETVPSVTSGGYTITATGQTSFTKATTPFTVT